MSPKSSTAKKKKAEVDLENLETLEPGAGDTGATRPASPGKSKGGNGCDPEDPVCVCDTVKDILKHYPREEASLIMVLQEVQDRFNWLPDNALEAVADEIGLTYAKVRGVATFYKAFSLEPRGKKVVKVCMGTACHVRGAGMLVDELKRSLKVVPGHGVTEDGNFSLETVNCVGACAMAPAVVVGDNYYANMAPGNLGAMLKKEMPK